jgi:acetyl-CoA carboxylase biotin carboxyl carrier protein
MKGSKKQSSSSAVAAPGVDFGELERLLSFMSNHGLEEFEYAHGDLKIRLKKAGSPSAAAPVQMVQSPAPAAQVPGVQQAPSATTASAPLGAGPVLPAPVAADEHIIKSPIVGTFYAGSSPEAGPFVRAGDKVDAGQTVCIIEAMKLMNEIEADVSGEIARVLVENGQPVEYGEPLFAIRPSGNKK